MLKVSLRWLCIEFESCHEELKRLKDVICCPKFDMALELLEKEKDAVEKAKQYSIMEYNKRADEIFHQITSQEKEEWVENALDYLSELSHRIKKRYAEELEKSE